MKAQRIFFGLSLLNLLLLAITVSAMRGLPRQESQQIAPVLRGRALEIVDSQGRVRAALTVLPATTSARGDRSAETVLLRLITERGRPSVKIGSSEESAGLSFAGPTGTNSTYVILKAEGKTSTLKLRNEGGVERVLSP
jgi:hypothetical protein